MRLMLQELLLDLLDDLAGALFTASLAAAGLCLRAYDSMCAFLGLDCPRCRRSMKVQDGSGEYWYFCQTPGCEPVKHRCCDPERRKCEEYW